MNKSELWDKLKEEMEVKAEGKWNKEKGYIPDNDSLEVYQKMCQMEILAGILK
jgi:hypothetical protein